ncbi:HAD family hydrolase [Kitasatospora griseola]|uniref:HAD family hydrolase n=1 Tax=Kitasatospora griseola TaxID=2064 RepID=UPI00069601EE|nr:HAD family hydrolase [Kitasatospora griseola]
MRHAVLFDLDGVLLDSRSAHLATPAGYATSILGRRVTIADLPADAATVPRDQVLATLGLNGGVDEAAWDAATATAGLHAKLFPFTVGTLTALRESGVATGLVTLRSRRRIEWLLPTDVLDLLDIVVCFGDTTPKPAPDGLLLALDQLDVTPQAAVFVGDTRSTSAPLGPRTCEPSVPVGATRKLMPWSGRVPIWCSPGRTTWLPRCSSWWAISGLPTTPSDLDAIPATVGDAVAADRCVRSGLRHLRAMVWSHGLHRGGASYLRRAGELRTTQSSFSARLGV